VQGNRRRRQGHSADHYGLAYPDDYDDGAGREPDDGYAGREPYDGYAGREPDDGYAGREPYDGYAGREPADDRAHEDRYDGRAGTGRHGRGRSGPPRPAFRTHRTGGDTFWARRSRRRARRRAIRSARRTVVGRHPFLSAFCAVVIALTPVWVSLGNALTNPSLGGSVGARGAEWFREHGGSSIVNWVENVWYSHHPPPVGGTPAKGSIPDLPSSAKQRIPAKSAVARLPVPARMTSPAGHRLPGEGVWHPGGRPVGGIPAVYETWVRPDAVHTSLVIGVAWMDTKLLRATLYSGSLIPGGGPYRHSAPVRASAARSLVAAFNSGFLMGNANGGYYTDGRSVVPLRKGAASLVIYRNGSVKIGAWGRDAGLTPNVVSVRQNLGLLVDHGKPITGLNPNDTTQWGFTLGNAVDVWRSGVGITANGALVYAGGPGLNITTLADILARAGAVRAMELDINTDWVNFAVYDPRSPTGLATSANGKDLLPGMFGQPDRYFQSWWARDFFTMSARTPPRATAKGRAG
jgi:Phosphodiester glycosidase